MRSIILMLMLCTCSLAQAASPPTSQPVHVPVAVPYRLTDTNHLMIRLKINGQGPYNFIVDTGAPTMFLREPIGKKIGLKIGKAGIAQLKSLEIEGGLTLHNVSCLVETPYQIEGMNAIGAPGVELDGLLGYTILSRFRIQLDLSKDRMMWTQLDYTPQRMRVRRTTDSGSDAQESQLEATGSLMKVLGPLIKPKILTPLHHGVIGIELTEADKTVSVLRVLGNTPAEAAGIKPGDRLVSINNITVHTIAEAQAVVSHVIPGKSIDLQLKRNDTDLKLKVITGEGL